MTNPDPDTLGAESDPVSLWKKISSEDPKPIAIFYAYDQDELDRLAHSGSTMIVLNELEQKLHSDWKYAELSPNVYQYVEKLREFLADLKTENHLPR